MKKEHEKSYMEKRKRRKWTNNDHPESILRGTAGTIGIRSDIANKGQGEARCSGTVCLQHTSRNGSASAGTVPGRAN
ncbi:MAG: hypothetical protein ACTSRU_12165, partial [Candidatus Hodarchaeales archaeon]